MTITRAIASSLYIVLDLVLQGSKLCPTKSVQTLTNNFQYFHGDFSIFSRNRPIMLQLCSFWGFNSSILAVITSILPLKSNTGESVYLEALVLYYSQLLRLRWMPVYIINPQRACAEAAKHATL